MARPIKHTRYFISVTMEAEATPRLALLLHHLEDLTGLHARLVEDAKARTRQWIRDAAKQRHTTANALGATPSNYLGKRAKEVEGRSDGKEGTLVIKGAIFARVFGPVVVTPKRAKMLTIPVARESYAKRARDFDGLVFKTSKKTGKSYLAQQRGSRLKALFVLMKKVTLPQDAGLLPSDAHYAKWSEAVASDMLEELTRPD